MTPLGWLGRKTLTQTFSLQNVPESAGDGGIFPFLFAVLSLVFELKQNF